MNKVKYWLDNARWISFPQSLLPALVALTLAWQEHRGAGFGLVPGLLAVLAAVSVHFGMNLFDDYFDYRYKQSGTRAVLKAQGIRARIGKCPYLQGEGGASTVRQLGRASLAFCLVGVALGLVITYYRGLSVWYVALAGALIGIEYSAPPLRLSYHGLGELVIGLLFGPVLMAGVYVSACGAWSYAVLFLSVPVGLLVTNIVYTHSVIDREADKAMGKRTFAGVLGTPRAMLVGSFLFTLLPFVIVTCGVIWRFLSPWYLLVWLLLPRAVCLLNAVVVFMRDPGRELPLRWWVKPVQQWEHIRQAGIEWFMIRWLAARNLLMFFALILIAAGLLGVWF